MPDWYAQIARHNPVTPIIDAARSIMLGPTDWSRIWISLGVIALIATATYPLAGRQLARIFRET